MAGKVHRFFFLLFIATMAFSSPVLAQDMPDCEEPLFACFGQKALTAQQSLDCLDGVLENAEGMCAGLVHMMKGEIYYNCGYFDKAADEYSKHIEFSVPYDFYIGYISRGDAYLRACRFEDALNDYDVALEHVYDESGIPYLQRGVAFAYLGDMEAALVEFHNAFERYPESPTEAINLSQTYLIAHNKEKFEFYLDEAVSLIEEYGDESLSERTFIEFVAMQTISTMTKMMLETDGAEQMIEEMNLIDPDTGLLSPDYIINLAHEDQEKGDCQHALSEFITYNFFDLFDTDAKYHAAQCAEDLGMSELAIELYQEYLCLAPDADNRDEVLEIIEELILKESNDYCKLDE